MDLKTLSEPFPATDIEWRVQSAGENHGKAWARVLAYVTNRAIMDRLDDVCGHAGWKNNFETGPNGGVLCCISIKVGDEWIPKWDGADNTDIESVKGGISSAMKRTGVQWGIGRYLYNLKADYAIVNDKGAHYQGKDRNGKYQAFKWDAPELPSWALPSTNFADIFAKCATIDTLKIAFTKAVYTSRDADRPAIEKAKETRKQELSK